MPSALARHWQLDPAVTFLNHGSFGATPRHVLEVQREWRDRMEADPIDFLARRLGDALASARAAVASFVRADPDDLAFVTNATAAVNTVIRSLRFEAGDEILTTDHEYNAVLNVIRHVAERDGAKAVVVALPFPAPSADELAELVVGAASARTRLAVVSHIASPTGIVLPIERIVAGLRERGIDTFVDGAHAPGQVPLDLETLGAAYFTGNLHKWVCAPKGAAFLHVRRDRQAGIRPATISHGANAPLRDQARFRAEFDWQGTLDPSAWLAAPAALEFLPTLVEGGWPAIMERNRGLALAGRDRLRIALAPDGGRASADEVIGSMAAVTMPRGGPLGGAPTLGQSSPLDSDPLQAMLWERFRIEVPIVGWPVPAAGASGPPARTLRISMALHTDLDDVERLASALETLRDEGGGPSSLPA